MADDDHIFTDLQWQRAQLEKMGIDKVRALYPHGIPQHLNLAAATWIAEVEAAERVERTKYETNVANMAQSSLSASWWAVAIALLALVIALASFVVQLR